MLKEHIKLAVYPFLIGILISLTSLVFAASASSSWGYYGPFLGYEYKNQAEISNFSTLAVTTRAYVTSHSSAPTGYMGAQDRLYNSDGELVTSGNWFYNDEPVAGIISFMSTLPDPAGYYYARGQTAAYNGNGYSVYWTFKTPNLYWGGGS
jgi:hypothetical protein